MAHINTSPESSSHSPFPQNDRKREGNWRAGVSSCREALRRSLRGTLRWGWFVLGVLVAFGYLTAGLSRPAERRITELVDQDPAGEPNSDPTDSSGDLVRPEPDRLAMSLAKVNQARDDSLASLGFSSSEPADWMTVCRRMSLALVGTGLSLEEIRRLERLPESEREPSHLESLLRDPRFHDYWGERWTRFLVGTDNGPFIVYRRRRFRSWLSECFAENVRYDQLVRRLVTAEGLWTDRPEVNFFTATFDSGDEQPDPVRLAARTSRVFLGLRIDCLQCHDDFLGNVSLGVPGDLRGGRQQDFHRLAAFFSSAESNGLQGIRSGSVDYRVRYLDAEGEQDVEAAVPYRPDLLPVSGNPRHRLAAWITHPENLQAARSAVSHVWALLFGRSLRGSVDDLPLDDPGPPMLEALAEDFIDSGYDLRHLIRVIIRSDAFRVDSRAAFEVTPEHESSWAVFPLTRLRPEQVAGSVIQSARVKRIDRDSSWLVQLQKFGGTNDFVERYGDLGEDEFTGDSVTISQRLLMLNGKLTDEAVDWNPVLNASAHIAMFAPDDASAVETLYLSILNRRPGAVELEAFTRRLGEPGDRNQAIEDLCWVLLNSSEFAWNH